MDIFNLLEAAFLGLIEGLTEFIPVSSTGHLLLIGHFLGFESTGKTFEVLIQLGAILAILTVYSAKLLKILTDFPAMPARGVSSSAFWLPSSPPPLSVRWRMASSRACCLKRRCWSASC